MRPGHAVCLGAAELTELESNSRHYGVVLEDDVLVAAFEQTCARLPEAFAPPG